MAALWAPISTGCLTTRKSRAGGWGYLGLADIRVPPTGGLEARDEQYELLAAHLETYVRVEEIIGLMDQTSA